MGIMGNKENHENTLFETGICEKTHSKQAIVSVMLKLKASIDKPIIIIKNNSLEEVNFTDVYNENGCIYLKGKEIKGQSILEYIESVQTNNFNNTKIKYFFSILLKTIDAAIIYNKYRKSYPLLLLNSIYYDNITETITIIPGEIAKILYDYLPRDEQISSSFSILNFNTDTTRNEEEFVKSLIYTIYLFFLKLSDSKIQRSLIYDLRTLVKNISNTLAKTIWNVLKGKKNITINTLKNLLKSTINTPPDEKLKIPIFKRKGFINLSYKISYTIINRWKLITIIAIIAGIFIYSAGDLINKSKLSDISVGMTSKQVVNLYIKSVKDLDVGTINSILYKRAGRDIMKEVSSLFISKKMTEIYGQKWLYSEEVDLNDLPEDVKVYGIEDVKINEISDSQEPIFSISYRKVFGERGDLEIYNYQEKLTLKKVKNAWFIINDTRKLLKHKEIKNEN